MTTVKKLKSKKCRNCKDSFIPWNSLQVCCGPGCAIDYDIMKKEKKLKRDIKQAEKVERANLRDRKEKLKRRQDWIKDLQVVFNKFCRLRDFDDPCISCGRHEWEIEGYLVGGKWDCGHYLSIGAHPELRFTEFNGNKQCKSCNGGAGKFAKKNNTVTQQYRINLIAKIGQNNVDVLESKHEPLKLDISEIKERIKEYKQKIKQICTKLSV
jgi:hypothetical protein